MCINYYTIHTTYVNDNFTVNNLNVAFGYLTKYKNIATLIIYVLK